MFAVVQNGAVRQILQMDVPFTVGDKTYSSAFLRTSTPTEKLEAGVWEIIQGARVDDRFYWVSGAEYRVNEVNSTVEATFPHTAKALEDVTETVDGKTITTKGLKSNWTTQVNHTANSLLTPTDWVVIRKIERNVDIPADIATYRAAVITECARLKTAITAAADLDAFIAVVNAQNWPAQA
jgi:hypothetical protein